MTEQFQSRSRKVFDAEQIYDDAPDHLMDLLDGFEMFREAITENENLDRAWKLWEEGRFAQAEPLLRSAIAEINKSLSLLDGFRETVKESGNLQQAWMRWRDGRVTKAQPLPTSAIEEEMTWLSELEEPVLASDAETALVIIRQSITDELQAAEDTHQEILCELAAGRTEIPLVERYREVSRLRWQHREHVALRVGAALFLILIASIVAYRIWPWLALIPILLAPVVLFVAMLMLEFEHYEAPPPHWKWKHPLDRGSERYAPGWKILYSRICRDKLQILARRRGRTVEVEVPEPRGKRQILGALNQKLNERK